LPEYLEKISGLSSEMLDWSLEAMMRDEGRKAAWRAATKFTRRPKDPRGWLTVWGEYGVGKTYVLASIVNQFRLHETAAIYAVTPDLLDRLRQAYQPNAPQAFDALFAEVRDIPVLGLDELGQVKMTPWAVEKLFLLLDHRYREAHRLATTVALHFEPNPRTVDWPDRAKAILSRLQGPPDVTWPIVEMSGGDVRKM
jgi:DNA replication protein DnaC